MKRQVDIDDIRKENLDLRPTRGNRHTGSKGISKRQTETFWSMIMKLETIKQTPNLFVGYTHQIQEIQKDIWRLLMIAGRAK